MPHGVITQADDIIIDVRSTQAVIIVAGHLPYTGLLGMDDDTCRRAHLSASLAAGHEQSGEHVPIVVTHRIDTPHGPVHAKCHLVAHLYRCRLHTGSLECQQAVAGVTIDAVGQRTGTQSLPSLGRELLGGIGPRVTIMEIEHHLKAPRPDGLAQADDIIQILTHALVVMAARSILRVNEQAHAHHVPALLTE